jgi:hypothetical protein
MTLDFLAFLFRGARNFVLFLDGSLRARRHVGVQLVAVSFSHLVSLFVLTLVSYFYYYVALISFLFGASTI